MRTSPLRPARISSADTEVEARVRELFERHFDFIWRLLRRRGLSPTDADDAAQQVFMIATRKLDGIASGSERSFLYGAALRVASNARRTTSRRREVRDENLEGTPNAAAGPDGHAELSRAWALLHELLGKLPGNLRRIPN